MFWRLVGVRCVSVNQGAVTGSVTGVSGVLWGVKLLRMLVDGVNRVIYLLIK